MGEPRYPSLYQINTRVWLTELSRSLGRPATLDDIPDAELDRLAESGLRLGLVPERLADRPGRPARLANKPGVAQGVPGDAARPARGRHPGSGFAITGYTVHQSLGGDAALARLRERLARARPAADARLRPQSHGARSSLGRGTSRVLHPRHGTRTWPARPQNYTWVKRKRGDLLLAHGRDPYLPRLAGHAAAQLRQPGHAGSDDRRAGEDRRAVRRRALRHGHAGPAGRLRADLGHPRSSRSGRRRPGACASGSRTSASWPRSTGTWNGRCSSRDSTTPTTSGSTTASAKATPGRCASIFYAGLDYQNKLARFLENHDEPRAAATFPRESTRPRPSSRSCRPGLRFFHQGQFEGRQKRISPHLVRAPDEAVNRPISQFYDRLLPVLRLPVVRDGQWQLLECAPAWDGNGSSDAFIAYAWQDSGSSRLLVAVNYAPHSSQCYVRLPFDGLGAGQWRLRDLLGDAEYERDGADLQSRGLYLDVPAWQSHAFEMRAA